MKKNIIIILLGIYRLSVSLGLWSNSYFISIFRLSYWQYKTITDRKTLQFIKKNINDGDYVVDIGAMIGFHTCYLASNIGVKGLVYAFEPEKRNYSMLCETLKSKKLDIRVITVNKAVSSDSGKINFSINNDHPADHHISSYKDNNSYLINAISLDNFFKGIINRPIKFIKIDVQGHELEVLKGSYELILKDKPMILLEIDSDSLNRSKSSKEGLIQYMKKLNYSPYIIENKGIFKSINLENIDYMMKKNGGYYDFLFIKD